jgi:RNA polymerase sigma factor (sigma-70 family)
MRVISRHADSLLRTARRHSLCADDAQDAYQRTMEIFVRRAATLDPDSAYKWVHTVCKHEAMAVRAQRQQLVSHEEHDPDREEARHLPSPEEQIVSFDRLRRSAEALQRLKPQELRALWLKAEGFSYAEICEQTGWTHTKVNRCISEGRRAFLTRYERIEAGTECERWLGLLSAIVDGEATPEQLIENRPHLRNCAACRATVRELHATSAPLAVLLPVAVAPAAGSAHERATGLLVRIYEAIAGNLHERAAAMADVASTGKLAAIAAAGAAAIAGGGAVFVHGDTPATHRSSARHGQPVAARVTAATPARLSAAEAPGHATRPRAAPRRAPGAQRPRAEFRKPAKTEFVSASTATQPAPQPTAPTTTIVRSGSPEPSSASREFASEFGD